MKNNCLKKICFLVIVILFSILCGFLIQNYQLIGKSRGIDNISLDDLSYSCFEKKDGKLYSTCDDQSITINKNTFINKIQLDYSIENNVSWTIKYEGKNIYGINKNYERKGSSNKFINLFSEKIGTDTSNIKLSFDKEKIVISNIRVNNNFECDYNIYLAFIIVFVGLYLLIVYHKFLFKKEEFLFLVLATTFGLTFLVLTPNISGVSWDDQIHFDSSYSALQGQGVEYTRASLNYTDAITCSEVLFNTYEEKQAYYDFLNNNNKDVILLTDKSNALISFNQLIYLPMSLTLKLCDVLNVPIDISFLLGRMVDLFLYIGIVFLAIKKTPVMKKAFLTIGMIPTVLFLATQYNRDSSINAFLLLAMAYFLYEYYNKNKKISRSSLFVFLFSTIWASCTKAIYIPFILIFLLLPSSKFDSKKSCIITKVLTVCICLLVMATFVLPAATTEQGGDLRGGATSVSKQMKLVINQPLSFTSIFYNNAIKQTTEKMVGMETLDSFAYIEPVSHQFNANSYYLFLFVLLISLFADKNDFNIKFKHKVLIIIDTFIIFSMIWAAMYLSFTPVGEETINGVQGRYFIPLLILLIPIFKTNKVKLLFDEKKATAFITIMLILVNVINITQIFL